MLHKLKNDEIDEIEIPENPNPNQSLFVCLLLVCTYPNLQMFVSYKPENGELSKFFSSHRFKGQGPNWYIVFVKYGQELATKLLCYLAVERTTPKVVKAKK